MRCAGCGKRRDESFNPDGPDYDPVVLVCRGCEARERHANHIRDAGGLPGAYIGLDETPATERITADDLR